MDEKEQLIQETFGPDFIRMAMQKKGITADYLACKLKQELTGKVTKTLKVKGGLGPDDLPAGFRVIATSSKLYTPLEGEPEVVDGETVIQWDEEAQDLQQRARMDAHKLRGDYPDPKLQLETPEEIRFLIVAPHERHSSQS